MEAFKRTRYPSRCDLSRKDVIDVTSREAGTAQSGLFLLAVHEITLPGSGAVNAMSRQSRYTRREVPRTLSKGKGGLESAREAH